METLNKNIKVNTQDKMEKWQEMLFKSWQEERAKSQLTLGGMIEKLKSFNSDCLIRKLHSPHSYRGHYDDLAFEIDENGCMTIKELLNVVTGCLWQVFYGWKGGEFLMHEGTPIWIAEIGDCGVRIIDIRLDGDLLSFERKEPDDE